MPIIYSIYSDTGKEQKTNHLGRSPPALEDKFSYRTPAEPSLGAGPWGLLHPLSLLGTGDTGTGPSSWWDQCKFPGAANSLCCHRDPFGCRICFPGKAAAPALALPCRLEPRMVLAALPPQGRTGDEFCLLAAAKILPLG